MFNKFDKIHLFKKLNVFVFFTGSLEGRVAALAGEEGSPVTPTLLLLTALAAAPGPDSYTVTAGLESGEVRGSVCKRLNNIFNRIET